MSLFTQKSPIFTQKSPIYIHSEEPSIILQKCILLYPLYCIISCTMDAVSYRVLHHSMYNAYSTLTISGTVSTLHVLHHIMYNAYSTLTVSETVSIVHDMTQFRVHSWYISTVFSTVINLSLLQNIVCFIGLFCKRDLYFEGAYSSIWHSIVYTVTFHVIWYSVLYHIMYPVVVDVKKPLYSENKPTNIDLTVSS